MNPDIAQFLVNICTICFNLQRTKHLQICLLSKGIKAFAEACKKNPKLAVTTLNLSRNQIGAEGCTSISGYLEVSKVLTSLNLARCNLGKEGMKQLAKGLKESNL